MKSVWSTKREPTTLPVLFAPTLTRQAAVITATWQWCAVRRGEISAFFWGFYTLLGSSGLEVLDLLIDPLSIKHISGRVYITQIAEYGRTTCPNTRTSSEMFRDEMFCLKNSDILNDCKVDSGLMMQAALGRPCEKFKETSIKF